MTAYTYASLQASIAAALVQAQAPYTAVPADFAQLFPNAVSYAEGLIARDLVLLNTRAKVFGTVAPGTTTFSLTTLTPPSGLSLPMTVVERLSLVVAGTSYFYAKSSLEFARIIWPNGALSVAPTATSDRFFAMENDTTVVIVPTPDQAYQAILTGLFVMTPMSAANTTTYIGNIYGDLMFAACMLWLSGALMRNFGASGDEPTMAISWKNNYNELLPGAKAEEARRRGLIPDIERPPAAPGGQQAA